MRRLNRPYKEIESREAIIDPSVNLLSEEAQTEKRIRFVEDALDYLFEDRALPRKALTHRSLVAQIKESNECLETLGDSVLRLVMSEILYKEFCNHPSKTLYLNLIPTKIIDRALSNRVLEALASDLGILPLSFTQKDYLPPRSKADAFEAMVAAIFLDGGYSASYRTINRLWNANKLHWHDVGCEDIELTTHKSSTKSNHQTLGRAVVSCCLLDLLFRKTFSGIAGELVGCKELIERALIVRNKQNYALEIGEDFVENGFKSANKKTNKILLPLLDQFILVDSTTATKEDSDFSRLELALSTLGADKPRYFLSANNDTEPPITACFIRASEKGIGRGLGPDINEAIHYATVASLRSLDLLNLKFSTSTRKG